jgi:hypothetical protein
MPDTFPPHSELFFPAPAKEAAATATAGVATTETEPRRKGDGEKGARTKRSPLSTSSSAASSSLASQQHQWRLPSEVECVWFDCEVNPFTKSKPFFSEVVFFHAPSRTLFCSDVWWNYPATETPNYSSASEIGTSAAGGAGAAGAAAEGVVLTGGVHACSKVEEGIEIDEVPSITRAGLEEGWLVHCQQNFQFHGLKSVFFFLFFVNVSRCPSRLECYRQFLFQLEQNSGSLGWTG